MNPCDPASTSGDGKWGNMWEDKLATLIFWLNVQSVCRAVNVSLFVHECVLLLKGITLCTVILNIPVFNLSFLSSVRLSSQLARFVAVLDNLTRERRERWFHFVFLRSQYYSSREVRSSSDSIVSRHEGADLICTATSGSQK